jgi:hypothetical protein
LRILIAKRNREHPLADQGRDLVLDPLRTPLVVKARRKPIDQINGAIACSQK